jgi:hypothetical protein
MYGNQNNLDVSIKASIMEDVLKRIPVSFDKVGIEFLPIDGENERGTVRIRIKNDDGHKQFVLVKNIEMEIRSPGYLLIGKVPDFKTYMSKFGDNLKIVSDQGQYTLVDESGQIQNTAIIIDDVNILDIKKIFPYVDGRILYPQMENGALKKDENGKYVMKPSDSYATIPIREMKRSIRDAQLTKNDYISLKLLHENSTSMSGKYDLKGMRAISNIEADVGSPGDVDLPKSIDEFVKIIGDGNFSIHFSDDFPVVTMVYEEESEQLFYTIVKLNTPKPGE